MAAPYSDTRRGTMVFDEASRFVDDPHGVERAAWDGLR